ncbi:contact-dependent growth inhibition system immunity protein [Taylorella equigenitalis]|uniref:contact-dependent growth inhibition system immunity protein n=1 Tax=Taylorella equigenitalis TaxID=29575 RepID=UPI000AAC1681|nr:contact-dependent growth inhibition system immunity protein [Taylorella equigenitalis]
MPQFNELDLLIYGYLNEDFDLICHTDSLEGAIDYYVTDVSKNTLKALLNE